MGYLLGVLVSLIVEGIKRWFGTDTFMTYLVLFGTSLIGAVAYVYFSSNTALWQAFMQTVVVAAAFHGLLLKKVMENMVDNK